MIVLKKSVLATLVILLSTALCGNAAGAEVVLLNFSSTACAPCQEMRPVVSQLSAAGYRVRHIDIAHEPALAAQFKVDRVPTFISLVEGREHARLVGTGTLAQLEAMLSPGGTVRGQSPDTPPAQGPSHLASVSSSGTPMSTFSNLDTPSSGRIVEIQDPNPAPARNLAPSAPTFAPGVSGDSSRHALLLEATVKVSVEDPDGTSAGTGTIVDARDGAALVLTCGHLFRTSAGKGPITVTFYQATPSGAQVRETVAGQVLNYDLERDLALVVVRPNSAVRAIPIAPVNTPLTPGAAVTSVGCNGGANPTAIPSKITTIDRYQGPPNVEVAGAPVEGRSGGGLFNEAHQLVGVCFAADPQSNEGLYASLPSIIAKLDSLNLQIVYQSPSTQSVAHSQTNPQVAAAPAQSVAVRGQDEFESVPASLPTSPPAAFAIPEAAASAPLLSASEQAALAEIQARGLKSEVICIIRPHDPKGKSEVITLNNVSPQFVHALAPSGPAAMGARSPATAAAGQLLR